MLRFVLIWGCRCSPGSIQRRVKCRRRRRGESRFNFNVAYLSRCLVSPSVTRAGRVEIEILVEVAMSLQRSGWVFVLNQKLHDFRRGTSHDASRITISHVSQTFHVHVHINLTVTAHGDSLHSFLVLTVAHNFSRVTIHGIHHQVRDRQEQDPDPSTRHALRSTCLLSFFPAIE